MSGSEGVSESWNADGRDHALRGASNMIPGKAKEPLAENSRLLVALSISVFVHGVLLVGAITSSKNDEQPPLHSPQIINIQQYVVPGSRDSTPGGSTQGKSGIAAAPSPSRPVAPQASVDPSRSDPSAVTPIPDASEAQARAPSTDTSEDNSASHLGESESQGQVTSAADGSQSGRANTGQGGGQGGVSTNGDYLPQSEITDLPVVPSTNVLSKIQYPPLAAQQGIEATVFLELFIDPAGQIRKIIVLKDPGFGFADAAVQALTGVICQPARTRGIPVAVRYRYPVRFALR
jgi:TonB family protein